MIFKKFNVYLSVLLLMLRTLRADGLCKPGLCRYGECEELVNNYACHCVDGVKGKNCDLLLRSDENRCLRNPCWNAATCTGSSKTYTCTCKSGYSGINCKTQQSEQCALKCQNGGKCINDKCVCASSLYGGTLCELILSNPSTVSKSVYVLNKGGYTAIISLTYKVDNVVKREEASVTSLMSKTFKVSSEATNVVLRVDALGGKINFLTTDIEETQVCYHVWGTTLYPTYSRMNC